MNKLYKALIFSNQVSLSVLDTRGLAQEGVKIHNLKGKAATVFADLLSAAAYMAGCLKSDKGAISITVKGGDGSSFCVSGDKQLRIRGYADCPEECSLKGGYMTVIKDDGFSRPFVGATELVSDDVSQNLMQYFTSSEQIDTAVALGSEFSDGECVAAGGVVMQLLPGTSAENMDEAENSMQHFVNAAEVVKRLGADGIMEEYFRPLLPAGGEYLYFPEYKCNCSRQKLAAVVLSLGKAEAEKIVAEEGAIKIHCHYCNADYVFSREDVKELFN